MLTGGTGHSEWSKIARKCGSCVTRGPASRGPGCDGERGRERAREREAGKRREKYVKRWTPDDQFLQQISRGRSACDTQDWEQRLQQERETRVREEEREEARRERWAGMDGKRDADEGIEMPRKRRDAEAGKTKTTRETGMQ